MKSESLDYPVNLYELAVTPETPSYLPTLTDRLFSVAHDRGDFGPQFCRLFASLNEPQ